MKYKNESTLLFSWETAYRFWQNFLKMGYTSLGHSQKSLLGKYEARVHNSTTLADAYGWHHPYVGDAMIAKTKNK
jgi:hypothetical protein